MGREPSVASTPDPLEIFSSTDTLQTRGLSQLIVVQDHQNFAARASVGSPVRASTQAFALARPDLRLNRSLKRATEPTAAKDQDKDKTDFSLIDQLNTSSTMDNISRWNELINDERLVPGLSPNNALLLRLKLGLKVETPAYAIVSDVKARVNRFYNSLEGLDPETSSEARSQITQQRRLAADEVLQEADSRTPADKLVSALEQRQGSADALRKKFESGSLDFRVAAESLGLATDTKPKDFDGLLSQRVRASETTRMGLPNASAQEQWREIEQRNSRARAALMGIRTDSSADRMDVIEHSREKAIAELFGLKRPPAPHDALLRLARNLLSGEERS